MTKDYTFKVLDKSGIEIGSYYSSGESVIDAFEGGVGDGSIYFNGLVKIIGTNNITGLTIAFEACKAE